MPNVTNCHEARNRRQLAFREAVRLLSVHDEVEFLQPSAVRQVADCALRSPENVDKTIETGMIPPHTVLALHWPPPCSAVTIGS